MLDRGTKKVAIAVGSRLTLNSVVMIAAPFDRELTVSLRTTDTLSTLVSEAETDLIYIKSDMTFW